MRDTLHVLTTDPISIISLNSGTTKRKHKLVSWNDKLLESMFQIYCVSGTYRGRPGRVSDTSCISSSLLCRAKRKGNMTRRKIVGRFQQTGHRAHFKQIFLVKRIVQFHFSSKLIFKDILEIHISSKFSKEKHTSLIDNLSIRLSLEACSRFYISESN